MTGFIGIGTTLAALNSFATVCMNDLQPNVSFITLQKEFGPAFICLALATVLKSVDIVAHVLVPVPEKGYWTPRGAGVSEHETQKEKQAAQANPLQLENKLEIGEA